MERRKDELRGETLRKLRKDKGLTQQQLADRLGLSKQAISKFEQGISYSLETAQSFANFFNVDLDYLAANTRQGKIAKAVMEEMIMKKDLQDKVLSLIEPRIERLEQRVRELENQLKKGLD